MTVSTDTKTTGFAEDQIWLGPTSITKQFVSETSHTASFYNVVSPSPNPGQATEQAPPDHSMTIFAGPSLPRLPELDLKAWPLTDPDECHLFHNFETNLAVWLDLCE